MTFILDYIVKYQNNFVSSYLFQKNLSKIIEKGIPIYDLLNSDVFVIEFDFDDWPSNHTNNKFIMRPFQHSIFDVRDYYKEVFPDIEAFDNHAAHVKHIRVFKIKYKINLLGPLGEYVSMMEDEDCPNTPVKKWINKDRPLSAIFRYTEELNIFKTEVVQ